MTPDFIGVDTETYLMEAGLQAPPLVVMSFCTTDAQGKPNPAGLLLRPEALATVRGWLENPSIHLVLQNAAFDMAVFAEEEPALLPLIFAAYAAGRIHCTKVREMMLHNATVGLTDDNGPVVSFALSEIVKRRFEVDISADKYGADSWRLRYGELDGKPIHEWPDEARRYAGDDAVWALQVYMSQEKERDEWLAEQEPRGLVKHASGRIVDPLEDEPGQTRSAFVLHLMQAWGILTDEPAVNALEAHLTAVVEAANEKLRDCGILKGKGKKDKATGIIGVEWSKDTKRIKNLVEQGFAAQGLPVPRTDPSDSFPQGQVKTDEETLRTAGAAAGAVPGCGDLLVLADNMGDAKILTTHVQGLKGRFKKGSTKEYEQRGRYLPGRGWLLNPQWNNLLSTGRTSCTKPILQILPRKGGVRECYIPRPGFWFLSVDYSYIEMVAWAQTCLDLLGRSDLADAIRPSPEYPNGRDPHCILARNLLESEGRRHTYEEVLSGKNTWAKGHRKTSKAGNFGLMGGMGVATFAETARKDGLDITEEQAAVLKRVWMRTWTEAEWYFNHVSSLQEFGGERFTVVHPRTGFVRAGCTFTSGCNFYFQGLAARGAKEALWDAATECYVADRGPGGKPSPLFGSRLVAFVHDELILEVPAHREAAHAASERLQQVMIEAMSRFTPDVPVKTEPTLMDRWHKEAEPVYGKDGVLELWTPPAPAETKGAA